MENIGNSENDERKVKLRFEQIDMIKFQMREKEELVKASMSDENLEINVEDISEVREMKGKEVEDERTIMRKVEAEKINELENLLAAHNDEQIEPLWPSVIDSPQLIDKHGGQDYEEGDEYIYWPN